MELIIIKGKGHVEYSSKILVLGTFRKSGNARVSVPTKVPVHWTRNGVPGHEPFLGTNQIMNRDRTLKIVKNLFPEV